MEPNKRCVICTLPLTGRQARFCSTACKNKHHQCYVAQKNRGLTRKLQILREMGGKCSICGYNKNLAALTFHHTHAPNKQFKLDMRSLSNRTWNVVQQEKKQCVLLCANCHAELHNPDLDLDKLLRPTATFAAPFEFVGWTLSLPRRVPAVESLHLPLQTLSTEAWLGITLSYDVGFPEFDRYIYKVSPVEALCKVIISRS